MSTTSFSSVEITGAVVVNVFAILSFVALLSIGFRILYLLIASIISHNTKEYPELNFFQTQLGYYAACLLAANMFNSIAGLMGLPFLAARRITEGTLCMVQATLMQFGNIATAYFTLAIAIHTLASLVFRKRQGPFIFMVAVTIGWASAGAIAILPLITVGTFGQVYGISGFSCGVRPELGVQIFLLHILPIFVTAGLSAALYVFVYLVLRGVLKLRQTKVMTWNNDEDENYRAFVSGIAKTMLWYPVAYCTLLSPYSIIRLVLLLGVNVPLQAMAFAFSCWFMLGIANAFGFYNTFRVLAISGTLTSTETEHFRTVSTEKGAYLYETRPNSLQAFMPALPNRSFSQMGYYNYGSPSKGSTPVPPRNEGLQPTLDDERPAHQLMRVSPELPPFEMISPPQVASRLGWEIGTLPLSGGSVKRELSVRSVRQPPKIAIPYTVPRLEESILYSSSPLGAMSPISMSSSGPMLTWSPPRGPSLTALPQYGLSLEKPQPF